MAMTREQILRTMRMLSQSQGLYGRILQPIVEECKEQGITNVADHPYFGELEEQGFADAVELVMYIEG